MVVERKLKLNNSYYFVGVEVKYNKKKLSKIDNSYYDDGDMGILFNDIANNYSNEYDNDVLFMNDVLFIYDRVPFLRYVKEVYYDDNNVMYCNSIIYKEEIDNYIVDNNIVMNRYNKNNSVCPLLF